MISRTPAFKSGISEWVSPIYLGWSEWLAIAILALSSILGLVAAVKLLRRRPDISIILVAVGASAWMASRNVQNFVIVLSPALLLVASSASFQRIRLKSLLSISLTGLSLVWILALFFLIRDYQGQHDRTGIGIQRGSVPEDASRFLNSSGFEGNVVNVLGDGGYLIWAGYPRWKVFVDGRLDVYGEAQINEYRRIIEGSPDALAIFERLGAGAAVLPMPPLIGSVRNLLSNASDWVLAYFDDYYLVYLNRDAKLSTPVDALAFKRINPMQSGYGISNDVNPDSLLAEAGKALNNNPRSSLVNAVYAQALARQNEYLQAAAYYKKALSIQPGHLDMYRFIGEMYSFADTRDSAKTWLETALKHRPGDPWIYFDLGMLEARNNDMAAAEYYFRQAVALDPRSPARRMLDRIEAMKSSPK
jgi:hypothetical protein